VAKRALFSVFCLFLFLNYTNSNAQTEQKEKHSLIAILEVLKKKYNISFSYVDETIKDKKASPLANDLTLEEALAILKQETNLDFEILNKRFVAIKKGDATREILKIEKLEAVTVTTYLTSGITKLTDGSITVKPDSFGILPGLIEPDVLQTIQALPGILSTDETISNINVRGGTHDQNLFLWDGIKMYQSGHFFGLISAFNPYTTKRVTIFKNGTSAQFGDGVSSVIEMQMPNQVDNEFKAGLGVNMINVDGFIEIPLSKKIQLQLSSRRSITDWLFTPTYEHYFERIFQDSDLMNTVSKNAKFYFYDINAKLLYDISKKDRIRIHFLNVKNALNYDEESAVNDINEVFNSKLSQQNTAVGITHTRDWNESVSTTAQIYLTNYDLDATNYDITDDQRLIQENEVIDDTAKLELNYTSKNQLKINSGYQFSEVGISSYEDVSIPEYRSFVKEVLRTHSLYSETSLPSNKAKINLKFGVRLNYIPKFDMVFAEPRLSFSQPFLTHFHLEVLGELKSQTTTQIIDLENDFLGVEKRRWVLSNNLKETIVVQNKNFYPVPILKSKQASIGIHYTKNKLLVSAETYFKRVDGITTRSQGFQNQFQYVNDTGSYEVKGVDLLINKQFKDIFSSWISYSYSSNYYMFSYLNDGEKFRNNTDIKHAFTFGGTYTYGSLKLALGLNWHSGKPTTKPSLTDDPNDSEITYQSPNSSSLSDYLRADCSTTYQFNLTAKSKASLGISVWNILNKKNVINTYYSLNDENEVTKVDIYSLGITPNISLRVNF
jgi:hypothetical protein